MTPMKEKISIERADQIQGKPFYFPSGSDQLFGFFTPANGRDEAVVICYPAPQEIMRSFQAHVQLHRRLQDLGYAVLRFDYAGTGDSEGEISLARWRDNIIAAVSQVKSMSGASRVSLIGTRLGAALALQASTHIGVKRILLWDGVTNGADLIRSYEAAHQLMLKRVPDEPPFHKNQKNKAQCCGFSWSDALRTEIASINPDSLESHCSRIIHVQAEESAAWTKLSERWIADGKTVQTIISEDPMHWDSDIYMKLRAVPQRSLQAILRVFEEA